MFTLRELLNVTQLKEFLVGDIDNEQYTTPFWYEIIEYPTDQLTLELRGWMDKEVVGIDVEKGLLKITINGWITNKTIDI